MTAAATDLIEGRNEADRAGAQCHTRERHQEGVFAADAVAHPAEYEGAERTDQKARSEQRDRAKQCRDRVTLFEELDRQDRGQTPEYVEVIPLDDVASRRSGDHSSEVWWNTGSHIVLSLGFKEWFSRIRHCDGQTQSLTLTQGCPPPAPRRREWQPMFRSW